MELDKNHLQLLEVRETYGRGLVKQKYSADGNIILGATSLWFDRRDALMTFLETNPDESHRVGYISGVMHNGVASKVYFVLVEAGTFVNHFSGLRRTPNVKLVYDPSKRV